jgi:rieske iron-sulfur protein
MTSMPKINYVFRMNRIGRRTLLKAGVTACFGLRADLVAAGQSDRGSVRVQEGDLLVMADDRTSKPLTPADIRIGAAPVFAWAMDARSRTVRRGSRLDQILLARFDPGALAVDTRARAAGGVVAYTTICTHLGCDVSEWLKDEQLLHCPCHGSKFDPRNDARVVEGEAPRPLPALPLKLDQGRLRIAGPFTARVGFESL